MSAALVKLKVIKEFRSKDDFTRINAAGSVIERNVEDAKALVARGLAAPAEAEEKPKGKAKEKQA